MRQSAQGGSAPLSFAHPSGRALSLFALCLASCSPHTVQERPDAPVTVPKTFGGESAKAPLPERWWVEFRDPELDRLVDSALKDNFDLHAAWARLFQAMATADQAGASRWPTLDLELGGQARNQKTTSFQRRETEAAMVPGAPMLPDFTVETTRRTTFGATGSLAATYEIDLWNRLGSTARAAALERDAAADAVQTLAMSVAAEVAEAWLDLVQVQARRELLTKQLEINDTFVELLKLRFGQGLSNSVEINQQRQQSLETRAQLELTVSQEAVATHKLALLLGKAPGQIDLGKRTQLPEVSPLPGTGVPSQLLKRRPDIRAAQRRVEAADHRIAVAVADRYPSLRLSARASSEPSNANGLNEWDLSPIFSLAANLTMPIFDAGRRAAEVDRRRAMMAELVAGYGTTVLTALVEVENALALEGQQRKNIEQIEEQAEVAALTFQEARRRFANGLSDFLTVLTSLRSQQQVELSLLGARRQLLSHRIQLCRALGGTWMAKLSPPKPRES